MSEFNASRALQEVEERSAQLEAGGKFVPVATAIIAVFAALATLFSNHSSVSGLQLRTQAGITQTKASDQYNYYESKRIKAEVNQALLQAGLITNAAARSGMRSRIEAENAQAAGILSKAQAEEAQSEEELDRAEGSMRSYESHEVAATLFEVAIVLVSITAIMQKTRGMTALAGVAALTGLAFFLTGFLR
jgi:hypothetical protein